MTITWHDSSYRVRDWNWIIPENGVGALIITTHFNNPPVYVLLSRVTSFIFNFPVKFVRAFLVRLPLGVTVWKQSEHNSPNMRSRAREGDVLQQGLQSDGTCVFVFIKKFTFHCLLQQVIQSTGTCLYESKVHCLFHCVFQHVFQYHGSCACPYSHTSITLLRWGHCHVITAEHVLQHEYITTCCTNTQPLPLTARHTLSDALAR
jgi:hypothetical protein